MDKKIARSRAQERRGAALHGGRPTIGSGNTPWQKGDVNTRQWGIEYKRTDKTQIVLHLEDIEKQRKIALLEGRGPLFGIEIGKRDYLLVEAEYLADLEERASAQDAALGEGTVLQHQDRPVLPRARQGLSRPAERRQDRVQRDQRPPRYTSLPDPGPVS